MRPLRGPAAGPRGGDGTPRRTLRPDSGRKTTARPAFYPSRSQIAPKIVARFLEQQDRLLTLLEATRGLDLDGITITSPVSRVVTYSLMDAYRIIVCTSRTILSRPSG